MIAIILAAGLGSRLNLNRPKGLLNIYGKPLIAYSIDALISAGIEEIYLVIGYKQEHYKNYFQNFRTTANIRTIYNPKYEDYGSLYSLYVGLNSIEKQDDIVIMDADIIYNADEFIEFIQNTTTNSIFTTNVRQDRHDACYVEIDAQNKLRRISKNMHYVAPVKNEYLEHIGIVKTQRDDIEKLIEYCESKYNVGIRERHEYDYAFESIDAKYESFFIRDYVWGEIDDDIQLKTVITDIYPKLNLAHI
ncbi:NTP transferase domain-containing protein [Sphingobacterium thalpophilum]|uniref:Bifunctional protein GlmU n=1 Tax=Sphingobacterium thalpophilum TaxID=259 RepID=A0A4U9VPJ2_9SPHI|nr:NTP transferase domain-containing protein [Sphingobacterium thalpophilum]VTR49220.1 Bifunctional protein GlmU [Sphingobacterium thalpophilum]